MAETSYFKCGDLSLAYQVVGDGPVEHELTHAIPKLSTALIHAYRAHPDTTTANHHRGTATDRCVTTHHQAAWRW